MGNKTSSPTLPSNSSSSVVPNSTIDDTIKITGFGGYVDNTDTFALDIQNDLAKPGSFFTITGKYTVIKQPTSLLPKNNKTVVEVATLETNGNQTITIGTKTYKFTKGIYNISKTHDGRYTLINDSKDSLKTLIQPLSTGGKRKRHTKRRKTNKRSRRRSIRT